MPVLNYTTSIDANKTVSEVQSLLAKHGANRIAVDYDENGRPAALTFSLRTPHGPRLITLPVNVDAMQDLLTREVRAGRLRGKSKAVMLSRDQAERVAWRVVKDWLAAQLTLVETGMAAIDQVMLPYLHVDGLGTTLYEAYLEHENVLALEGGQR